MKNIPSFDEFLNEFYLFEALSIQSDQPGSKRVNIIVGRFQPPTLGHLKVLETISKQNGYPVVVLTVRAKKRNFETVPFKDTTINEMFGRLIKKHKFIEDIKVIPTGAIDAIFNALRPDYEPILWGTGTDRLSGYKKQITKYRKELNSDEDFAAFEIPRNEDNISASKVRKAIMEDDEKTYRSMMDKELWPYFNTLKQQLEDI